MPHKSMYRGKAAKMVPKSIRGTKAGHRYAAMEMAATRKKGMAKGKSKKY